MAADPPDPNKESLFQTKVYYSSTITQRLLGNGCNMGSEI